MIVNTLAPTSPPNKIQPTKSYYPKHESTLGCSDKNDEGEGGELR